MRVSQLNLNQVNQQLDKVSELNDRLSKLEKEHQTLKFQTSNLDFVHARPTFNNLTFTWTGGSTTLSWTAGWIKDKNAVVDTGTAFSQSPSWRFANGIPVATTHNIGVPAGSLTLSASTYYWLGWDTAGQLMHATTDITTLYTHHDVQVICQLFTGTGAQTGTAGGGGSQGGSDLSGARYKLF